MTKQETKRASQPPTPVANPRHRLGTEFLHPAFGAVTITECTGGETVLFGSDINHSSRIVVAVHGARMIRDLSEDWALANSAAIVEFEMTHAQFSAMSTSIGKGCGVPCTLRSLPASPEVVETPAIQRIESKIDLFSREIFTQAREGTENIRGQIQRLGDFITAGKTSKKELAEIFHQLNVNADNLPHNLEFVSRQAQKMLELAGEDAKRQVEAYHLAHQRPTASRLEAIEKGDEQ